MNDLHKEIREALQNGDIPIKKLTNKSIGNSIVFKNSSKTEYCKPILKEERCILIIDIVGFSKNEMEEQLLIYETLNKLLKDSESQIKSIYSDWKKYNIFKGTGDGGIFIFGQGRNPISVRDALIFAIYTMKTVIKYNNALPQDAINSFKLRMALSYDEIFMTEDLENNTDIIGDAINITARLASIKEAKSNSIFISSEIYHTLQINKDHFYFNINSDKSIPASGELSDFIVGKKPDANNFLYIVRKGSFETKDRTLEAFNISGRIDGVDIIT